ncbi:MAG TPA: phosphoadenosine phosphosulfate reductase family protein, partial [Steroidobacteraceae bacterium]|nr:phosphoadenosine phosphosulfate reductase family protein [Steroidobacteraceae bacterium]
MPIVRGTMADLPSAELETKAAAVRGLLAEALARHGRLVYANSLGAEAVVLTDIIWSHLPQIDVFSIDTGRLYEETYELLEKLQRRYQRRIRVLYPDAAALERLVGRQGVNGFYQSPEARLE